MSHIYLSTSIFNLLKRSCLQLNVVKSLSFSVYLILSFESVYSTSSTEVERLGKQGKNNLKLKALAEESKLKQVDRRISVNAPTILIILNEILTVNTPVSTMQQSPNVYLNWLACITNISGAKQHKELTSHCSSIQ